VSKIDELPLSETTRELLLRNLNDPTVRHAQIVSQIAEMGFEVDETSIRRYRKKLGVKLVSPQESLKDEDWEGASVTVSTDGATVTTGVLTNPLDLTTGWDEVLLGFGLDPAVFYVVNDTVKMSKWQQSRRLDNGDRDIVWLYSYKASFARRKVDEQTIDFDALKKRVQNWRPTQKRMAPSDKEPCTFVINWADWQIGKSAGGGVLATVAAVEESYQLCLNRLQELQAQGRNIEKVAIINMGDPSEGCDGNYSSQLFSVELNQREQLNLVLDLWANGIMAIQPDIFGSVLCNHGEWTRRGTGTRPVTTDSDNVGGYLADTLKRVFDGREHSPTEWHIPHDEMVTMMNLSGVDVAFTHGHVIPSEARELDWLRGQSIRLLREYGVEPRLWVTAHRHHVRVEDMGAWWRLQCPSLDGGSKWYSDTSGKWATAGTLTFLVGKHDIRGWSDLAVLGSGV